MTRPNVPTINWKNELARLARFLHHDGGVIHIRTTGESPSSAFAKALRSRMEHGEWQRPWHTIQIDGNNSATRYFSDMTYQLERTLGLPAHPIRDANPTVMVGTAIDAGGNVDIRDIHINNFPNGAHLQSRAQRIVAAVSESSAVKRLAILFFDSDNADQRELAAFRSLLWDDGLENLVGQGLLLIGFSDEQTDVSHWLPPPDETIDLPSRYDSESARNAIEDLAAFAREHELYASYEEAKAFATAMVANNLKPKELYANFAGVLSRIEGWK
jgi:hypothetical protein